MENGFDFTQGSITKKLIRFMLPILGALILQATYSAVDLLIVGRFGTTEGISGVSTGAGIMSTVTFIVSSLAVGVTVLMGQYIGAGKPEKLDELLGNAVCFFTVFAVVMSFALVLLARPLSIIMQAPPEALDFTVQYIRICGVGFIFVVFYNMISGIFRGIGNSRLPLLFVAIACVVNILGDLLLVAVLNMNVAGAAIATIAAQAVSVVISLAVIRRQNLSFGLKKKHLRLGLEIRKALGIGVPLAMQDLLTNISFLALCAFVNRIGIDASSGYGVAQRIQSFILLIPVALAQSMSPFVAQNVGANNGKRARSALKSGMLIGVCIGVPVAVATFFFGDWISRLFSEDSSVVMRSFEYLKGFAPEAIVTSVLFSFLGFFNGYSRSKFVMIQGLIQSFVIRLPVSYVMSIRPNASLTGIGLAAPLATTTGILLCVWYYMRMNRSQKRLER